MAGYVCSKCKFGFYRTGEVKACPACGSLNVSIVNANAGDDARAVPSRRKTPLDLRANKVRPYRPA
jgi:uncharacterized Zn finger protein (UPF0148 family)